MKKTLVVIFLFAWHSGFSQDTTSNARSFIFAEFLGCGFVGALGYQYALGSKGQHNIEAGGNYIPKNPGSQSTIFAGYSLHLGNSRKGLLIGVGSNYTRWYTPQGSISSYPGGRGSVNDLLRKEINAYVKAGWRFMLLRQLEFSPSVMVHKMISSYSLEYGQKSFVPYEIPRLWGGLRMTYSFN